MVENNDRYNYVTTIINSLGEQLLHNGPASFTDVTVIIFKITVTTRSLPLFWPIFSNFRFHLQKWENLLSSYFSCWTWRGFVRVWETFTHLTRKTNSGPPKLRFQGEKIMLYIYYVKKNQNINSTIQNSIHWRYIYFGLYFITCFFANNCYFLAFFNSLDFLNIFAKFFKVKKKIYAATDHDNR